MEQDDADAPPEAVVPGTARPSRSAKRIVAAVTVSVVVLAALAWWVLAVPYRVTVDGARTVDCDVATGATSERACDDAEDDRRDIALLAGAAVAIAACAVSTVPSRRLTGGKLGPLR
ncbi:hypothetical protein BH10ACT1_BH10ACT1_10330 [soil metagenome]